MRYVTDAELDRWIQEDMPYFDLTCQVAGIANQPVRLSFCSRQEGVVCGGPEVARIATKLGCVPTLVPQDGDRLLPGEPFCVLEGPAQAVHAAWKVCLNVFDHASGIATATAHMVADARAVNEKVEILTTRKGMPGAKSLQVAGIVAGGAYPHRLGLSETVLFFEEHLTLLGGMESFLNLIPAIKANLCEKKLFVECRLEDARRVLAAGADGVQFDKATPAELEALVSQLKLEFPAATFVAAGGINGTNVAAYAQTGVHGLVTTWPLAVKPLDMGVRLELL